MDEAQKEWVESVSDKVHEGEELVRAASDEALEYVTQTLESFDDDDYRRMVIQTQALETGVGIALADHLIPEIYNDMKKKLHKKLKVPKEMSEVIRNIYIGRVMKNIRRELDGRDK